MNNRFNKLKPSDQYFSICRLTLNVLLMLLDLWTRLNFYQKHYFPMILTDYRSLIVFQSLTISILYLLFTLSVFLFTFQRNRLLSEVAVEPFCF